MKFNKPLAWIFMIPVTIGFVIAQFSITHFKNLNRNVEICISWSNTLDQLELKSSKDFLPESNLYFFLKESRLLGVSSISFDVETTEGVPETPSPKVSEWINDMGFKSVMNLNIWSPKTPMNENLSAWFFDPTGDLPIRYTLKQKDTLIKKIRETSANIALPELGLWNDEDRKEISANFPERIVRAHAIPLKESKRMNSDEIVSRWARAVKERNVRFIYYLWNPKLSSGENIQELASLKDRLEAFNFKTSALTTHKLTESSTSFLSLPFVNSRQWIAFLIAVFSPLMTLMVVIASLKYYSTSLTKRWSDSKTFQLLQIWIGSVVLAICTGLLIQTLLPDTVFSTGLKFFRGVKASLVIPLVLSGFLIFSKDQIMNFFAKSTSKKKFTLLFLSILLVTVLLIRSGNHPFAVPTFELSFRLLLEDFFGARPRFKEYMVGHPLLILGITIALNTPHHLKDSPRMVLSKCFIWMGMIGWISIINSFCHLHTPIHLTLIRTLHGLWLGGFIGLFLTFFFYKFFKFRLGNNTPKTTVEQSSDILAHSSETPSHLK